MDVPPEFLIHEDELVMLNNSSSGSSLGSGGAGSVQLVKLVGRFGGITAAMKTIFPGSQQTQLRQAIAEVQTYMYEKQIDFCH